jgi:F-type H+-transporting ATPase subunit beta
MAKGRVAQVIGTVVDVEFPPDQLPALFNAIDVPQGNEKIVLEVQQHIGNNWARCLSLSPTEGLARGAEAIDTGRALSVPVGPASLGRLFNVLGEPLDNLGKVNAKESWPIHRAPPSLEEQKTTTEIMETGLKVIDLISPSTRVGRLGRTAVPASVRRLSFRNLSGTSPPSTAASRSSPESGNVPVKATTSGKK